MKPRFKLYTDGTVALATAPIAWRFHEGSHRTPEQVAANLSRASGGISAFCRRWQLPRSAVLLALHGHNVGSAMGGKGGTLRALLGIAVCSSPQVSPLSCELRLPVRALVAAVSAGGAQ